MRKARVHVTTWLASGQCFVLLASVYTVTPASLWLLTDAVGQSQFVTQQKVA